MMIDYKSYVDMDNKDLEQWVSHAKNILNLRHQDELNAVATYDAQALSKTFEHNHRHMLSEKTWGELDVSDLPLEKMDFFDLIRSLPQYQQKNQQYFKENLATYEEKMVRNSIKNAHYMAYCLDHEDYRPLALKLINKGLPMQYLKVESPEVIDLLVQREIIKPDNNILKQISQWLEKDNYRLYQYTGYLEYAIVNCGVKLEKQDAQDFFNTNWNQCSPNLREILLRDYVDNKNIPLFKAMENYGVGYSGNKIVDNYKDLVKSNNDRFSNVLSIFSVDESDINMMMKPIRNILNNKSGNSSNEKAVRDNMVTLFQYVHHHMPESESILELYCNDSAYPRFKNVASRLMLYIKLDQDIPQNDEEPDGVTQAPKI
jgi:hypothetical protein